MPRLSRFTHDQALGQVCQEASPHALAPESQLPMSFSSGGVQPAHTSGPRRAARDEAGAADLALYRSIFQQALDGILVIDAAGRVLEANPRACEMLGYEPGEFRGLELQTLLADGDTAGPQGLLSRMHAGDALHAECVLVGKSGERVAADVSVKMMDDGRTQLIMRDVAERAAQFEQARKDMEDVYHEAQMAVREREELLSIVSHDLKNPLAAIKGFAQVLQRVVHRAEMDETTARKLTEGLAQIESSSTRMDMLLNEQLDLARLQAGQPVELQRGPADLAALARQVAEEYQRTTVRHRLWVTAPDEGVRGHWDAERIERSLSNLVSNAVKYSPQGGEIEIAVEREEDEAGRHWAVCRVTDRGLGIPEQDLPRIFDWYTRASNIPVAITGTGIGLASVKQVVEQHGGAVHVQSREGEGSTFTVRLPV